MYQFSMNHFRIIFTSNFFFFYFLDDSEYADRPYLMVLLQNPQPEILYNNSQIQTRNVVERQIGVWKIGFPVLVYGMRCKLYTSFEIIGATAVLHNIAVSMNEDIPPPPENINLEQVEYLI